MKRFQQLALTGAIALVGATGFIACSSEEEEITVPDTIDGLTVTEIGKNAFYV